MQQGRKSRKLKLPLENSSSNKKKNRVVVASEFVSGKTLNNQERENEILHYGKILRGSDDLVSVRKIG